jgi:hypothetical protein
MNKKINNIASGMLILAIFDLPMGYYTFLRICISIAAIISLLHYREIKDDNLMVCFGLVLILFNPLIPIYLHNKGLWFIIDLVAAVIFYKYGYSENEDCL